MLRAIAFVTTIIAACSLSTSASCDGEPGWSGPGWYLTGPDPITGMAMIYNGPYSSQSQCEATKTDNTDTCRYLNSQADADQIDQG